MKRVVGRDGTTITVPAARAKDARRSNVHWLTPRSWRRWIDIGLRGHTRDGKPEPGWVGRVEERNVAYVRLMLTSGLRRAEGGSLLTFEVPDPPTRYGKILPRTNLPLRSPDQRNRGLSTSPPMLSARLKSTCEFVTSVGGPPSTEGTPIRTSARSSARSAPGHRDSWRVSTRSFTWCDRTGATVNVNSTALTVNDRMTLFVEAEDGPEPLWLSSTKRGSAFSRSLVGRRIHNGQPPVRRANLLPGCDWDSTRTRCMPLMQHRTRRDTVSRSTCW